MSTVNRINLEVDQYRRIGIKDVISLLKSIRNEAVIKIVKAPFESEDVKGLENYNENSKKDRCGISSQYSRKNSTAVKGNTKIPQIRELNEIAALLRSMDMQQRRFSS